MLYFFIILLLHAAWCFANWLGKKVLEQTEQGFKTSAFQRATDCLLNSISWRPFRVPERACSIPGGGEGCLTDGSPCSLDHLSLHVVRWIPKLALPKSRPQR